MSEHEKETVMQNQAAQTDGTEKVITFSSIEEIENDPNAMKAFFAAMDAANEDIIKRWKEKAQNAGD